MNVSNKQVIGIKKIPDYYAMESLTATRILGNLFYNLNMRKFFIQCIISLISCTYCYSQTFTHEGLKYSLLENSRTEVVVKGFASYNDEDKMYAKSKSLVIPNEIVYSDVTFKVVGIDTDAFMMMSAPFKEVILGKNVRFVNYRAFYETRIEKLVIQNKIELGSYAFDGCSRLSSIINSNLITYIGYLCFGHTNISEIDLAENTEIAGYAFCQSSLKSIKIPIGTTVVEEGVFCGCSDLTSIVLPNTVRTIGYDAFRDCHNLKQIICFSKNPAEFNDNIKELGINIVACEIIVPFGSEEAYKSSTNWKEFFKISFHSHEQEIYY